MGDIHGAARAVEQCLQLVAFDRDNDRLIQLGDICDGFSESYEAAEILMEIKNLIAIQGNHDCWLSNYLKTGRASSLWSGQGGRATLLSYARNAERGDDFHSRHNAFYSCQVTHYLDEKGRMFVHGGMPMGYSTPEGEDPIEYLASLKKATGDGVEMTEMCWDRDFLQSAMAIELDQFLYTERRENYLEVATLADEFFVGHTALRSEYPTKFDKVWAMDTNCGWGGPLTIMNVDTHEIFQSEPAASLYPGEQSR